MGKKRPWVLTTKLALGLAGLALGLVGFEGLSLAQAKPKEEAPKVKVERGKGGKKVYKLTTGFVIEGRIQKPNAFYVLQRSQINYDWASLKKDFTPRIVDALKRAPF